MLNKDEGHDNASDKYQISLMWPEGAEWDAAKKAMKKQVLEAAKEAYGVDSVKLSQITHPFKLGNERKTPDIFADQGFIIAKKVDKPKVKGPSGDVLDAVAIAAIKSGDYARAVVSVYGYTQQGGGLTMGLEAVQFSHAGDALTGSSKKAEDMLDELDVPLEDDDDDDDEDDDDDAEDDAEDEDEDDDSDDDDDDGLEQFDE